MRAVITVVGKDAVGILAKVSGVCARLNANIIDVNQTVLVDIFTMVMLAEIDNMNGGVAELSAEAMARKDKLNADFLKKYVRS